MRTLKGVSLLMHVLLIVYTHICGLEKTIAPLHTWRHAHLVFRDGIFPLNVKCVPHRNDMNISVVIFLFWRLAIFHENFSFNIRHYSIPFLHVHNRHAHPMLWSFLSLPHGHAGGLVIGREVFIPSKQRYCFIHGKRFCNLDPFMFVRSCCG